MKNFSEISGFDDELRRVGEKAQEIAADALMREPLSEVLTAVFSAQGKMLRPSLLLLFGRMGENYPRCADDLVTAGAIVELTHMASLIHDDIVDDAPYRRGRSTVQAAYGKDMAVYAGDYLLSRVLGELMKPNMQEAGQILSRAISDMCSGELGQYYAQFNTDIDENHYFMNISGKTASLFSASCEIGATIAGCSRQTASTASRFGHILGVLFQLRDDLLDCLPSFSDEGKRRGADFVNGIYTMPVIYSFADRDCGEKLRRLAKDAPGLEPETVFARLYEYISAAGGIDYTRWMIRQYAERAANAVDKLPPSKMTQALNKMLAELADC